MYACEYEGIPGRLSNWITFFSTTLPLRSAGIYFNLFIAPSSHAPEGFVLRLYMLRLEKIYFVTTMKDFVNLFVASCERSLLLCARSELPESQPVPWQYPREAHQDVGEGCESDHRLLRALYGWISISKTKAEAAAGRISNQEPCSPGNAHV